MLTIPNRKNKIDLSQYNYKKDIENRNFLSQLSFFDIQVLEEILCSSIQIPIQTLLKRMDTDTDTLHYSLEKIRRTELISIQNSVITVDKEMRKYFEILILKFSEDFEPNLDHIQNLLRLIPIHILPLWYALPRSTDNIFKSIVERVFASARLYERYLAEIDFEDEILSGMIQDLFHSPNLQLSSEELCSKYQLNRETFLEYALQLEYNFLGYVSYVPSGREWVEIITPFCEWRKFLEFKKQAFPEAILPSSVKVYDKQSLEERNKFFACPPYLFTDKNSREIERSLCGLINAEWVLVEDYLRYALICLDETTHLVLKKQGRSWKYFIPEYNQDEQSYILSLLFGRFHKQGFIEVGHQGDKDCFRLTSQGKTYLLSISI